MTEHSSHIPGSRNAQKRSPEDLLREACDRNIPVCVVRPRQAGRVPMARGRLLALTEDGIDIDRVQIPGLEINFSQGDALQAYFSIGETLYQFKTTLLELSNPKRLNARMVIPGMTIAVPTAIDEGDRRNIYRVSVGAREDRPGLEVWRIAGRDPASDHELPDDETPAMPSVSLNLHGIDLDEVIEKSKTEPDFQGWVVDATEQGLGIRLEQTRPSKFSIFEALLVRVTLPERAVAEAGEDDAMRELLFVSEVRSKRKVGEDGCRMGLMLIEENDGLMMRRKRNLLRRYLADVQREQLRNNRGRVA